ncbi:hypothetical protein TSUD_413000 [Trifolium subterraneum]|uniref:DUF4283 domain-containing protein n=1 Tax=Trifolium subterraneum TaxID=3900 RepID=A0A2Z6PKK1_TRISU|nr:hypothetical protein TSUD_413000 [Trifolium subterraneum]
MVEKSTGTEVDGVPKAGKGLVTEDGNFKPTRTLENKGAGERNMKKATKGKNSDAIDVDLGKDGLGATEGVRVGDIVVRLGAKNERLTLENVQEQEVAPNPGKAAESAGVSKEQDSRVYIRKFKTRTGDTAWALNDLVASFINGEVVPVVQNKIIDAWFNDLVLIPMGRDKVFVRSSKGDDAMSIVNSAKEFFKLMFSNWMRWDKKVLPYHRDMLVEDIADRLEEEECSSIHEEQNDQIPHKYAVNLTDEEGHEGEAEQNVYILSPIVTPVVVPTSLYSRKSSSPEMLLDTAVAINDRIDVPEDHVTRSPSGPSQPVSAPLVEQPEEENSDLTARVLHIIKHTLDEQEDKLLELVAYSGASARKAQQLLTLYLSKHP